MQSRPLPRPREFEARLEKKGQHAVAQCGHVERTRNSSTTTHPGAWGGGARHLYG